MTNDERKRVSGSSFVIFTTHPMFRSLSLFLCACALAAFRTHAATAQLDAQTFTLPDGFEIERVAGPPLVERPITADFDEAGRLYVSDSSGSNDKVEKQLADKPHRIVRLEDTDGDRRYDRRTVFADRMMFPEGTMWFRGSLYVSAPPSIWKLTDTDGDGVADRREEWFKGKTLTGCANDLHGPYRGRDGWIYWCKGAFAEQTHDLPGRPGWKTRAAHIFRARPDGSGLEPVMTGGMDNPVDVVFTPEGERIFSCTFFQHPSGGQRDGLIHALYGGVYGKVHDVLDGHARTGELLAPMTHLGPAAPSGLHYYESSAFGENWRGNLFACCFNLRKITRHELVPSGATFTTRDSDFLTSDSADFHPTDAIEDADGSLLIVDTGGWYKLCCPTSQLAKPDVLGAIYRVRKKDAPRVEDARGLKIEWAKISAEEIVKLLADARPAVRERGIEELARRGGEVVEQLRLAARDSRESKVRRNVIWALTRIDSPEARKTVRYSLGSSYDGVTQASAMSAGTWRDKAAAPQLMEMLQMENTAVVRAAAEALGRLGKTEGAAAMLLAVVRADDRALEHSIIHALLEIDDRPPLRAALTRGKTAAQKVALIALDQLGDLKPEDIVERLGSPAPELQTAAQWIASQHPDWSSALAEYYRAQIATAPESLAPMAGDATIQKLLADAAREATPARPGALRAMAAAPLREQPKAWLAVLIPLLDDDASRDAALAVIRARPAPKSLAGVLARIAHEPNLPAATRLSALAALPDAPLDDAIFQFTKSQLTGDDTARRIDATALLLRAPLTEAQRAALGTALHPPAPGDPAQQRARLDELSAALKDGDVRRGHQVYNSAKAACVTCHAMGYVGGKLGPDLSRIGQIRTERDLLEAIVFPSASFVRSYEPVNVRTKKGENIAGLLRGNAAEEIVLATGPETEARIARADLAEMNPGSVSPMPPGYDLILSPQELADLIAFLRNAK